MKISLKAAVSHFKLYFGQYYFKLDIHAKMCYMGYTEPGYIKYVKEGYTDLLISFSFVSFSLSHSQFYAINTDNYTYTAIHKHTYMPTKNMHTCSDIYIHM